MREKRKEFAKIGKFEDQNVVFQFQFTTTEDDKATSTGSAVWPIMWGAFTGSFSLGYDVGDTRQRQTDKTVKLVSTFEELNDALEPASKDASDEADGRNKLTCDNVAVAVPGRLPGRYPISGNIGLAEVFADYFQVQRKGGKFKSGGESYTDKIQFTTTINGSLKPGIDIARKGGPTIKASGELGNTRKDLHVVTIQISQPEDGDKAGAVQQVVITQMPAVRVRADVLRLPPLN